MDESNGHQCPECGALRARDNTPSCACTQRASDALRATRTAEAAAAEDFDPLRIRPYVEIEGETGETGETRAAGEAGEAGGTHQGPSAPDATMPLRAVGTERPGPMEATAALPTPLAPPSGTPSSSDLNLFEGAPGNAHAPDGSDGPYVSDAGAERPRRHRRTVLLGVTAAVVAVVAAAGYASGLFSYETPSRDGSASKDVRAAVPAPSKSASSTPSATTPGPASPAPTPTAAPSSASPSPSPSRSASSAPPSSSPSTEPTPAGPSATGSPTPVPEESAARKGGPDTGADKADTDTIALRRGDRGPEVSELQQRLRQLFLYNDDIDGTYGAELESAVRNYQWSRGIQDDELGVYGPATRAALESETKEP
ncbi:peptidoglycan-binding protein [Streptomyces sp. NPDC048751]|uniref:peptidoglycan-binding domain-containing protein n=1 Tax=Streptomyces sp. NPDC048751 TaxID=3365591 RepID=UPI0037158320